jgi:putative FmdB family regulatory protein
MPIYEYRCGACGHTLDALQKVSDPHLTDCPECEKPALKRLVSAPAFRLKGGGWYETDFKSDKEKKRNLVDQKGDGGDGKSDGGASKEGKSAGEGKSSEAGSSGDKSSGAKSSGDGAKPPKGSGKNGGKSKGAGGSGSEAA